MSSKFYSEDFKIETIRQIIDMVHSFADVASRLGATMHFLHTGLKNYDLDANKHLTIAEEQAEK